MLISTFHFRRKSFAAITEAGKSPLKENFNLSSAKEMPMRIWLDTQQTHLGYETDINSTSFINFKKLAN